MVKASPTGRECLGWAEGPTSPVLSGSAPTSVKEALQPLLEGEKGTGRSPPPPHPVGLVHHLCPQRGRGIPAHLPLLMRLSPCVLQDLC